jgi:hypothetical protein
MLINALCQTNQLLNRLLHDPEISEVHKAMINTRVQLNKEAVSNSSTEREVNHEA